MNKWVYIARRSLDIFLIFYISSVYAVFNFQGKSSFIKISSGGTFVVDQAITGFDGRLIKDTNSTILGESITFEQGVLQDPNNSILMTSLFTPLNTITLEGDDNFRAEPGTVLQSVNVSSFNNKVSGQPSFINEITLTDVNTTLTVAIQSRINQNINLNNGTIILEDDLKFADNSMLVGPGVVKGNGFHVQTGSESFSQTTPLSFESGSLLEFFDCKTDLSANFTFDGDWSINGHGNILDLQDGGKIIINSASTLNVADITLKGVGANSLVFQADDSELHICGDVNLEFVDDVTLSQGSIFIDGPATFILKDKTLAFDSSASMTIDGVTVWVDPAGTAATCLSDNITFGSPLEDYLTLVSGGTIKEMVSCIQINDLQSQIDNIDTSTLNIQFLQEQIDILDTSTQFLQDQIDILDTSTQFNADMIAMLKTSTAFLQDQIDILDTSTIYLQDQIDILGTNTIYLQDQIDILDTSTQYLQDQLDILGTDTQFLQDQVDILDTSTQFNADMIAMLKTSTAFLQDQIDILATSTIYLQDQIDILDTSTQSLQAQIDAIDTNVSSTQFLQDQIDILDTSTQFLQDQVDILDTSTQFNADMIAMLKTSTAYLQDQIDLLDTATQNLQNEIDNIETNSGAAFPCQQTVSGDLNFTLAMLPAEGESVYFRFSPCYGPMADKPKVIFDPAVYGGGGAVTLPKNSRIIFYGDGQVELKDGVMFNYEGTSLGDGPQADWPELVLENGAQMYVDASATAIIGGDGGKFTVRNCASVLLDTASSNLIFGESTTELLVTFDCTSRMRINNSSALVTFHLGVFDIIFDNHSSLDILLGTLEMNTMSGNESPGVIRTFHFIDGSSLLIDKVGATGGLLRLAPNDLDFAIDFDNRTGVIFPGGNLQFKSFGTSPIDTILQIQDNDFAIEQEMTEVFMQSSFIIDQNNIIDAPQNTILTLRGSLPDPNFDGALAALCPTRNGSIVTLELGDHDVRYDGEVIAGVDSLGRMFRISNCDASTRTFFRKINLDEQEEFDETD